jgi:hypothetical protein
MLALLKFLLLLPVLLLVFVLYIACSRMLFRRSHSALKKMQQQTAQQKQQPVSTDMQQCSRCNTYIPSNDIRACGRKDCPYA